MFRHPFFRVRGLLLSLVLIGVALTSGGCGSGGKVAAVVNGQVITQKEVDQRMARLNPAYRQALGGDSKRLLEEMIMETILIQEARRRGLERDVEVDKLVKEARRQILLGRLLETIREGKASELGAADVAKAYEENKKFYVEPETFRASHVLVATEQEAQQVIDRLKAGEDFAKVAQELSTDPTKARGGDIGYFSKGQLIPEFEQACEKLQPGEISGVIKTQLGCHVIRLTERKASRQLPLEEVNDQIKKQLVSQQEQKLVETFIQQLRAKAQVQIRDAANAVSKTAPANKPVAPDANLPAGGS